MRGILARLHRPSWTRKHVLLIELAAILAVAVALMVWRSPHPGDSVASLPNVFPEVAGPERGRLAPALAVPALNGGQVTLAQYAGQPRVVSFFASWCESCWNDMITLQRGYERYRAHGVMFLGIGVHDTAGSLRYMTERLHLTFPVGYDERGDLAAGPFHLYTVPTTIFVDAHGVIKGVVQGRVHSDTLQRYLALILPAAATPQ